MFRVFMEPYSTGYAIPKNPYKIISKWQPHHSELLAICGLRK